MHSTIVKTDALVLKSLKYGDTSKIVTFYTKEFGKLTAMAKGVRKTSAKYGTALEPLSVVSLVLYHKNSREIQLVSECSTMRRFTALTEQFDVLTAALTLVELVYKTSHEEKNETLFHLLLGILEKLNSHPNSSPTLLLWFHFQLAEQLGFGFQLETCPLCRRPIQESSYRSHNPFVELARGGILCATCSSVDRPLQQLNRETLSLLRALLESDVHSATAISISASEHKELKILLHNYFRFHIEGWKPLKSERIFSAMAQ
ncbi:MAG: DNA repair protein RecO [Ignavibacteriales bacterium]|nr:DNA repair protein RecO [Ignavibacteriales bacterium]